MRSVSNRSTDPLASHRSIKPLYPTININEDTCEGLGCAALLEMHKQQAPSWRVGLRKLRMPKRQLLKKQLFQSF
jgi:hypothetical protein